MGAPKNFYNAVDLNKFGIDQIEKRILPVTSASDDGKIAKVIDGKWSIGDDIDSSKIMIIDCTLETIDDVEYVVLPDGITVSDMGDAYCKQHKEVIVRVPISNGPYYEFMPVNVTDTIYEGVQYYVLAFTWCNFGARRNIDGVYKYFYAKNRYITFNTRLDDHKSVGSISEVKINTYPKTYFDATLTAGSTSVVFSDPLIHADAAVDVYTSVFGVDPTNVVVAEGSVTVTFDAQQADIMVRIEVSM